MNTIDYIVNDSAISSEEAPTHKKQCKTSWYSKLKEDPEAFAIYKEKVRLRNETRKIIVNELEERGVIIDKPKKHVEYKKIDPEVKQRYNMKYYSTHRDQIIKHVGDYVRNEYTKDHSPFVDNLRRLGRKHYHEVIKNSPEKVEMQRARMRIYMQNKTYTPEEAEKRREYVRAYKAKKREQLKIAKSQNNLVNTDSESSNI